LICGDESTFFDSVDYFTESDNRSSTMLTGQEVVDSQMHDSSNNRLPQITRRSKLPEPTEKEKGISLWSIIKDSVGKDLTRVCLPVYFNEPLSSLQKCFEDLEYSYLLDQAYQHGKVVRSLSHLWYCTCLGILSAFHEWQRSTKLFSIPFLVQHCIRVQISKLNLQM